jgi:hypothetical protein
MWFEGSGLFQRKKKMRGAKCAFVRGIPYFFFTAFFTAFFAVFLAKSLTSGISICVEFVFKIC